jgi:hypothetical protein
MTDLTTLTDTELDRIAAVEVMGWTGAWWDGVLRDAYNVDKWHPTTNPADDYRVLEHVRDTWGEQQFHLMQIEITAMWRERLEQHQADSPYLQFAFGVMYRPGDYARAAIAAIKAARKARYEREKGPQLMIADRESHPRFVCIACKSSKQSPVQYGRPYCCGTLMEPCL